MLSFGGFLCLRGKLSVLKGCMEETGEETMQCFEDGSEIGDLHTG